MFTDIVLPKNNEKEFIEMACKLNVKSLCFLYQVKNMEDFDEIKKYKIGEFKEEKGVKLFIGVLTDFKDINSFRGKTDLLVMQASEKNREILERAKPDMIINLEISPRKDFIYNRNSGLNQVLCNIAKDNDVIIGINNSIIINSKDKYVTLGRIKQNIKLCQKYKVKITIASFARNPYEMRSCYELKSLLAVIGANTSYQKQALSNTFLRIKQNNDKRSPEYISEGIKIINL